MLARVTAAIGALLLAGCGSSSSAPKGNRIPGRRLTIYASLPFVGPSSTGGEAALGGARMALAAHGDRIGRYQIILHPLNDATRTDRGWDPGQTSANARLAVKDPTTVGYLGDLDSGASAVAIPVLSRAGITQISPGSTAVGLTEGGPEASPGEPQKYYPTNRRTFARVVPNDAVQAAVQARLQLQAGCRRTYMLDDGDVDGGDAAAAFAIAAQGARLPLVGTTQYDPKVTSYTSLAATIQKSGADCVLFGALPQDNAVALTEQIADALPGARLFAWASLADSSYLSPVDGGLPTSLDARLLVTDPTLGTSDYPPSGRRFLAAYARRYGGWQPASIYGFEAMSLMLDAVGRATQGGTRPAVRTRVTSAVFHTRARDSVLGAYSINGRGDTSLDAYGVYRVIDGRLQFWKAVDG